MTKYCPYCHPDTAGNHESHCPYYYPLQLRYLYSADINAAPSSVGWICPRCGRGVAPWKNYCDCLDKEAGSAATISFTASNKAAMETSHVNELSREERVKIARSAFGMWADREDLGDTVDYVAGLRAT